MNSGREWGAPDKNLTPGQVFRRVGGRYAFSQRAVLPTMALLSVGTAFNDSAQSTYSAPFVWVTIAVLAGTPVWLGYTLIAWFMGRLRFSSTLIRGIVASVLYAVVEATRAVLVAFFALQSGETSEIDWAFRIVAGGSTGFVLMSLVAIVSNDTWQFRRQVAELDDVDYSLREALQLRQSDLERRFDELFESVRDTIKKALKKLVESSADSPESARLAAIELLRVSDEVVRPLSHSLYQDAALGKAIGEETPKRVSLARAVHYTSVTDPFRPGLTVFLGLTLMLGQVFFGGRGLMAMIALVSTLGGTYLILWAAQRFVTPRLVRWRPGVRWLVLFLTWGLISVVMTLVISHLLNGGASNHTFTQAAYGLVLGEAVYLGLAVGPGIARARAEILSELSDRNRELRWHHARINARLLAEQKWVARVLHRDVQGVLVAAALRLENALRSGDDFEESSAEVKELIELATDFVIARQPVPLTGHIITQLKELWAGVLDISDSLEAEARKVLDKDAYARQSFAEAAGEFCVDSVKHGRARHVVFYARAAGGDLIELQFTNDGAPLPSPADSVGLGSTLLTSTLLDVRRVDIEGGVQVTALLPTGEELGEVES